MIKFRTIKDIKGMSLYVDGERLKPEPGGEMSAEQVQGIMLALATIPFFVILYLWII